MCGVNVMSVPIMTLLSPPKESVELLTQFKDFMEKYNRSYSGQEGEHEREFE